MAAEDVAVLVERLADAKSAQHAADAEVKAVQAALIDMMNEDGITSASTEAHKAALVTATTIVIDEKKLKRVIGARLWNKVTVQKLDKKKLEAAVELGEVDMSDVAKSSDEVPKAPYIRITAK